MPADDTLKKLIAIAEKVKGTQLSWNERARLSEAYDRAVGSESTRLTRALSESLNIKEAEVRKRAGLDDTDRLVDDILALIKKGK